MSKVRAFINAFPEGSAEREYHTVVANIVEGIDFDVSDANQGIGLLDFLTEDDFVACGVDTRVHSVAGSRQENAMLTRNFFDALNRDTAWWVTQSLQSASPWQEWWKQKFRESPIVEQVFD